jgi:large subunit ribosomal protein L22
MEQPVLEAKAVQRHLRKAPRKVRLVADSVRGKGVDVAIKQLEFLKKGASIDVAKVIKSAAANAPQGRAHRINKRSCHITVVVAKKESELVTE